MKNDPKISAITTYDVIILGAGAAGLMAAYELSLAGRKTLVIEARQRVGGRIFTIYNEKYSRPVEAGAEFVHGDLELTKMLIKKAGLEEKKLKGSIWQNGKEGLCEQEDFIEDYDLLEKKFRELKEDISVAKFFEKHLGGKKFEQVRYTLQKYVEGYYAGKIENASAMALCKELTTSSDRQSRIKQGYRKIADWLYQQSVDKGVFFQFSSIAKTIEWEKDAVIVRTADGKEYNSNKIIITVPLGVLQSDALKFDPSIRTQSSLIKKLGFGSVIKVIIEFHEAFWKDKIRTSGRDLSDLSFLFSDEKIPVWWTQHPDDAAFITGWLGGPNAEKLKNKSDQEIFEAGLNSLSELFNIPAAELNTLFKAGFVYNWTKDPFALGGYSYQVVNSEHIIKKLQQPVQDTIWFAGEGLCNGPEVGTVEGALQTGRTAARELITSSRLV